MATAIAPHVATEETDAEIAASRVIGALAYDRSGESIGSVDELMVDKASGTVGYAVLNFGGVLVTGGGYCRLPWASLRYDEGLRGYQLDVTRAELQDLLG